MEKHWNFFKIKLIKWNLNWGKKNYQIFFGHKNIQGKKKLANLAKRWQLLDTLMEFTLEKTKIPPFFCHKNFQEKKTVENLAKHWKILDRFNGIYTRRKKFPLKNNLEFTLKNKDFPPFYFFVTKTFRKKKKTLKYLAKNWKILHNLMEFTLEEKNSHIFLSQKLLGKKKKKN